MYLDYLSPGGRTCPRLYLSNIEERCESARFRQSSNRTSLSRVIYPPQMCSIHSLCASRVSHDTAQWHDFDPKLLTFIFLRLVAFLDSMLATCPLSIVSHVWPSTTPWAGFGPRLLVPCLAEEEPRLPARPNACRCVNHTYRTYPSGDHADARIFPRHDSLCMCV